MSAQHGHDCDHECHIHVHDSTIMSTRMRLRHDSNSDWEDSKSIDEIALTNISTHLTNFQENWKCLAVLHLLHRSVGCHSPRHQRCWQPGCCCWCCWCRSRRRWGREGGREGGWRKSDSSGMLSKENALIHHSVNLHADDHWTVVLQATVTYRKTSLSSSRLINLPLIIYIVCIVTDTTSGHHCFLAWAAILVRYDSFSMVWSKF